MHIYIQNMYKVAFKADGTYQLIGWYCSVKTQGTVAAEKNMREVCTEEQYDYRCVCGGGVRVWVCMCTATQAPKRCAMLAILRSIISGNDVMCVGALVPVPVCVCV